MFVLMDQENSLFLQPKKIELCFFYFLFFYQHITEVITDHKTLILQCVVRGGCRNEGEVALVRDAMFLLVCFFPLQELHE